MSVYWIDCFLCILDLVINVLSNQNVLNCGHEMMNYVSQSLAQFQGIVGCTILLKKSEKCKKKTAKWGEQK